MNDKFVYLFTEGKSGMKDLLGGKGANLAEMTNLGMPVPQGFTITTEACTKYYEDGEKISPEIEKEIFQYIEKLEAISGKKFGDKNNPLLVSIRSGARASMPGMMDTVLNLGINDEVAEGLILLTQNPRFVYDSYRRFIQMFSDVVMELGKEEFSEILEDVKSRWEAPDDASIPEEGMKEVVALYKAHYKEKLGSDFPQEPRAQLMDSVKAVFRSWDNPRAVSYRRFNDIPASWGTAVNVQSMVYGNMGNDSGTGVAFTRNPATGEKKLFGEFLINAQGEDVVAGIRTPEEIDQLKKIMPDIYDEFKKIAERLDDHYKDMQDMEFTIENGKLYMLQTRNGKRTASAALRIAIDLVESGTLSKEEALLKVDPKQLDALLHPQFDVKAIKSVKPNATGLAASPGAACGKIYFTAEEAVVAAKDGPVLLVRTETSPEDIEGMHVAQGILTARGGMTSHAAVVARGMGTCCVSGCSELHINYKKRLLKIGGLEVKEGEWMSIDGTSGHVYIGKIPLVDAEFTPDFHTVMEWADEIRRLKVRTNADTPEDAATAIKFGAEGIGLTRTEHMFFKEERIMAVREMIVSNNEEQRAKALEKLLPMQQEDFEGIYRVMEERPVTIRLLDPPLHEFLPREDKDIKDLAELMNLNFEDLKTTIEQLHETNPMMGHRGCRISVSHPEIARMQTRAIIQAAIKVKKETAFNIVPEIMIPLIGDKKEMRYVKDIVVNEAEKILSQERAELKYLVGTMIEVPRAALLADQIAEEAEFFSFGTNDLTQMAYGFSRDDSSVFLENYYKQGIFESDPFVKLDQEGTGKLVKMGVELGRKSKKDLKIGICGEHGGDPASVEFFNEIGLDYVSCSPYRVPIARLAAAQAVIKQKK
ncbi:MAG: pyruvate, phosphate dikinase [Anaerovoracaceae bacterium]|nr:pyruvate, phosphate dikinase [Anaerovoracaceae bacterium]